MTWTAEQTGRTMADGLRTNSLGPLPFEHLRRFMDEIVTASEEGMADAMRQLARGPAWWSNPPVRSRWPPTSPAPCRVDDGDDARVIVISGGNVDPELYLRVLAGEL